ncbi:MAG: dihydropteroate synthase [Deltaproteobacteria bacterium]|nr:MAG: dihydropteroate synthase [Deltaproteobacteria bacterium]
MVKLSPQIMGIVNLTPDSFSDGGRFVDPRAAIDHAHALIEQGADLLDLGAESTRPGADPVSPSEEIDRLIPVIEALRSEGTVVPISVDTTKAAVARIALEAGASWINDVSALHDPDMASVCAAAGCTLVLMHRRGTPKTMQRDTCYHDLIGEVSDFLADRVVRAAQAGIEPERVVLDPGVGFGKALGDNPTLIAMTPRLRATGHRVLIGASRKRFIGELTGVQEPSERVAGSIGAALAAAQLGADVVRVHDVGPTVQALRVYRAILEAQS